LSSSLAEGAQRLIAYEMEHREQFEELFLLRSRGIELCLSIIVPLQLMSPLPLRMRAAALYHARVVEVLIVLRAVVSSVTELVLGHSHSGTFRVEVMNELTAKFQELEELCSRLKGPGGRIYSLLLGPSPGHARWVDRLEEAAG
jgi:hypothetical protein